MLGLVSVLGGKDQGVDRGGDSVFGRKNNMLCQFVLKIVCFCLVWIVEL